MTRKFFPFLVLILITGTFFWQFFLKGLQPIPSDAMIGLYHPYRDLYAEDYPNGIPFKNFLITDPVRQIYPWKELSVSQISSLKMPLWNPYEMGGKPLMGNFQSSPFYPLNLIFLIKPFSFAWSLFIISQFVFISFFTFLYLRNLKLRVTPSLLGAIAFSFSGFVVSWFEWGNVIHAALWLPLILLSIDKIFEHSKNLRSRGNVIWSLIFVLSLTSSFLAGHLQIFFYIFIFSLAYLIFRAIQLRNKKGLLLIPLYLLFLILVSPQLFLTLQFISLSARDIDQSFLSEGWFIPFQHLIQFIFPDFFGNPATLNYWGIWNYAEFVGYIGVIPLIFILYGVIFSRKKEIYFFSGAVLIALLFSTQNLIAEIPFKLSIPFLSSSQPTRLIFIISFSLSVLASFGFDYILKNNTLNFKKFTPVIILSSIFVLVWMIAYLPINLFNISPENLSVLKRNLIFPSVILVLGVVTIAALIFSKKLQLKRILLIGLLILIFIDLFRFFDKFSPFSKAEYLFPQTKSIDFVKKDKEIYRIMSTDSRILAPNLLTHYKIQTVDGYDPLYLLSYAELIAASERGGPDIKLPYGFNRIITPHNYNSKIINLLNVKYVFSFDDIENERFKLVFEEGKTKVYENLDYLPRAFFVEEIMVEKNPQERINEMFNQDISEVAIVEENINVESPGKGTAEIVSYGEEEIIIKTKNDKNGFLVISDSFYPSWTVLIDGVESKIYRTDHTLRGIVVPSGAHKVVFRNKIF